MKRFDEYDNYEEDDDLGASGFDDEEINLDDDLFDDDEDASGPVTDEGALYFDMVQKLYATLEEYGDQDPALLKLQDTLNEAKGEGEDLDDNTFYLEEAIAVAQHIKKHIKDSPNVKRIYDNFMVDIVRFTDESAPGHHGDYYM